jgi:cell shape-determining protein MreC
LKAEKEAKNTKVSEREIKDLKEKTERYQQTIKQLKAENEQLKAKLGMTTKKYPQSMIEQQSSTEEA